MIKKIILRAVVALPFMLSQSYAIWEAFEIQGEEGAPRTVRAVWNSSETQGHFTFESASSESFEEYQETLQALPLKEGYPSVDRAPNNFAAQNIARQTNGNLYHLYKVSFQAEGQDAKTLLGFVQFGRMPSKGYPQGIEGDQFVHHTIIEKWIALGVTKKVDPVGDLADENITRIENRGLAMILPLFNNEADETQRKGAIGTSFEFVRELTTSQRLLPVEGTLPHVAISLFHPDDPNVQRFAENGFAVDESKGFEWFYPQAGIPQPRTMVTRLIDIAE